jgi:guanylate kinase
MTLENFILIISSPSGAGKTTITKKLLTTHDDLCMSVSVTTRAKRNGEVDGVDYKFVDKDQFKRMIDENVFLEFADVFNNQYGTLKQSVKEAFEQKKNVVFDIDWQGTEQLKRKIPNEIVSIFILPPSMKELEHRLKSRGKDASNQIELRLSKARDEISKYSIYDYLLINDNLDTCLEQINCIYKAEKLKRTNLYPKIQQLLNENHN